MIDWQNCFGGTSNDNAYDIVENNRGYFIVGSTTSNDGDVSFNHGGSDGWLIQTDPSGSIEWERTYGGSEGDGIRRILKCDDNNYYLLGNSNSSDADISQDPYPDSWDNWILKIDSTGNILWDRITGGNESDVLFSGTITNDNGIIAVGWSSSQDGDKTEFYGYYDIWIVKLNSDGVLEWEMTIGGELHDNGYDIIQTSDGGYLVGGSSLVSDGGNLNCDSHGNGEAVLIKLDSNRNIEWQQCYGGSNHDGLVKMIEQSDGYCLLGWTESYDGDISGFHGELDIWVIKTDFDGSIIWQNCLGGTLGESASSLYQINEELLIVGYTESNDGDVFGNHSIGEYYHDIWIANLDNDGDFIWQQCIGGQGDERAELGSLLNDDYSIVIPAITDKGSSFDVQCETHSQVYNDWWVFNAKDTTVGLNTANPGESFTIKVFPIPAGDFVRFDYLIPIGNEIPLLEVMNQQGVILKSFELHEGNGVKIWNTENQNGLYFYQVRLGGMIIERGKLIICN